jgi:hypothetical protein
LVFEFAPLVNNNSIHRDYYIRTRLLYLLNNAAS